MLTDEISGPEKIGVKFEFVGGTYMPILLALAGGFLAIFFCYFVPIRYGFTLGYIAALAPISLLMLFAMYFRVGHIYSDLIINEDGLSRRLYGIKWREMKWSKVVYIRVVNQIVPGTLEMASFIFVYSYDRGAKWIPFKPTIMFTDRTNNKSELYESLNTYVSKHDIMVYRKEILPMGGKKQWHKVGRL